MPLIDDREALFLAMLLHDTGKGGDRRPGEGRAPARRARPASGWAWTAPSIELVAWLVEHHLVMSDYAQKRDVSDPRTVADFARIVETPERLRLLLVLTVADIRAVGPGRLERLEGPADARALRRHRGGVPRRPRLGRGGRRCAATRRTPPTTPACALVEADPAAERLGRRHGGRLFHRLHRRRGAGPRRAWPAAPRRAAARRPRAGSAPTCNAAEVVVAAADRPRLFVDLAEAITGVGRATSWARGSSPRAQGQALDVFYVQDVAGAAVRRPTTPAR